MLEACEFVTGYLWKNSITVEYRESIAEFLMQCVDSMEIWKLERFSHHMIQLMPEECTEKLLWNPGNLNPLLSAFLKVGLPLSSRVSIIQKAFQYIETDGLLPEDRAASICLLMRFYDLNLVGMSIIKLNSLFEDNQHNSDEISMNLLGKTLVNLASILKTNDFLTEQIVKTLKNLPLSNVLETFSLVLALMVLSGNTKLSLQVKKHLSNATSYAYSANSRICGSAFLRNVCSLFPEPGITIDRILGYCSSPLWGCTVNGLIQFCFTLLRSASSPGRIGGFPMGFADGKLKSAAASTAAKSRRAPTTRKCLPQHQRHPCAQSPKSRASRLAINSLTEIFQSLPETREQIVTIILRQIWSEPEKMVCFQMTELMGELAALCPVEFTEASAAGLTTLLDSLGAFPLELSTAIIHALLPLFVVAASTNDAKSLDPLVSLQSHVVVVLRKMSSSYNVAVRRIAVAGFVTLLKNLKVSTDNFRTASQQSWSMSSQLSASQSWTSSLPSLSIITPRGRPLFSQIHNTQVAQAVMMLPTDPERNRALCTEIVGLLHRLISSTFFGASCGPLMSDPGALVKSDIYWGLCEVVLYNRGLSAPVLTLFTRLLAACVDPALSKKKPLFKDGVFVLPSAFNGVPLKLAQLVSADGGPDSKPRFRDHPEILAWCLQVILSLPAFRQHWSRFARDFSNGPNAASASSQFTQFATELTQSTAGTCGGVSMRVFNRAASLLLNLASGLRETPLDEFGLASNVELGPSPNGRLNQARLTMLLGLYDSCLEFEAKNLLGTVTNATASWDQLTKLFARRESARKLLLDNTKESGPVHPDDHTVISPEVNAVSTSNLCFIGMSDDGGNRLRGALLLSSLKSIVSVRGVLHRALQCARDAPGFALHLLQTTSARLSELSSRACGKQQQKQPVLSVVYRDAFTRVITKILSLTIRFYDTFLNERLPNPNSSGVCGLEATCDAQPSPLLEAAVSAVLQTMSLCFSVVMENLGSHRLHRLVCALFPVVVSPKPLGQTGVCDEEGLEAVSDDDEAGRNLNQTLEQSLPNASRGLNAIVKLFKGWVTRILTTTSSTLGLQSIRSSTPQPSASRAAVPTARSNPLIADLTILLPMLISLCEARTGKETVDFAVDSPSLSVSRVPDFSGLDRVLVWLLRLLNMEEVFEGKGGPPLGTQVARLALQLAHLLGSASSASGRPHPRRSSTGSSASDFTWDDLVVLFAGDIRSVFGDINDNCAASSDDEKSIPSPHKKLTFSVVTGKRAANLMLQILLSALNDALEDVTWLVNYLTQEVTRTTLVTGAFALPKAKPSSLSFSSLPDARRAREEAVCSMLLTLGEAVDELLQTALPAPSSFADDVIRLVTGLFSLLATLTKHYISLIHRNVGTFPTLFERVVRLFGRNVSPHSYSFVYFIQLREAEKFSSLGDVNPPKKPKLDGTVSKPKKQGPSKILISRNMKDAKLIPQLTFAVELYESLLAKLSRKAKAPLIDNVRIGFSRDFRINQASALARLEADVDAETAVTGADAELSSLSEGVDDIEDSATSKDAVNTSVAVETCPQPSDEASEDSAQLAPPRSSVSQQSRARQSNFRFSHNSKK
ncbi:unnamed protein product [Mesocestoides corti]|uniref:Fanconi anemia group I protein n=1 Tax=Mesocestoides corti TaxID=53468 RepID=A0A158QTV2_MESCO|nr:unnamed protein product [Mesocestoides corti]